MNGQHEITYALGQRRPGVHGGKGARSRKPGAEQAPAAPIARIARLLALAITLERRVRKKEFRDYAEVARLAGITRARMTQITKLLDLAPDIQEELLFMPAAKPVTERNLRPVAAQIAWPEQRRLFRSMLPGQPTSKLSNPHD